MRLIADIGREELTRKNVIKAITKSICADMHFSIAFGVGAAGRR